MNTQTRTTGLAALVAALILGSLIGLWISPGRGYAADQDHGQGRPDIPAWVTRPCQSEDSVNCRWIAAGPHAQGNGHGHTFVVRELPGRAHMVCVFYAAPRYARHHDYCA